MENAKLQNHFLATGQTRCWDEKGREIPCPGSGQDGEFRRGVPWPEPRFAQPGSGLVEDLLTGLVWTENANPLDFPLTWADALAGVEELNTQEHLGFTDWRLPGRRELRSLVSGQARRPVVPEEAGFKSIFTDWYWTSTSSAVNPGYAWYVHMDGGRMFYGRKTQYCLVWPVRGQGADVLPASGQKECFGVDGTPLDCPGSGQDPERAGGVPLPPDRFQERGETVLDRLTNLFWLKEADRAGGFATWQEALDLAGSVDEDGLAWRLPSINELESLVDCSESRPALADGHPFRKVGEAYWSSTTSFFETDWSWCLYMHKGAVGVGWKPGREFLVWPVADAPAGP